MSKFPSMGLPRATVIALLASLVSVQGNSDSTFDVLDYVDPFIGTSNGGHVFAGATLPFGMAKAVADTLGDNQAGFAYDTSFVSGFSHMHDSGTGGSSSLGNFPIFAQPSCPGDDLKNCNWQQSDRVVQWKQGSPKARPGYFSISLENGVDAEMTVTNHSALYQFTFNHPSNETLSPVILVDLMDLPQSRLKGTASVDPSTGRLTASGTFNPSFGVGNYDLHFCADFKGAGLRDTGVWINNQAGTEPKTVSVTKDKVNSPSTLSSGAFARFNVPADQKTILARVGVSFISVQQACSNAEREQPNFDFAGTVAAAEAAWREKLNVIQIDASGVSKDLQKVFWSGVYRTMISPQDYTGENPLWQSDEPYYDSYYCIWDSYRGVHQLLTLLDPLSQSRMIRSLVDIYRHEGYLPDCRMSLCKGFTQGGSNADVLIYEALLKNVSDVDWNTAYKAVVKDAEVEPLDWNVEGRGGLFSWKTIGYIPKDDFRHGEGLRTRSISRTVEYAYNDFCIAEMAKRMGHEEDYEKYTRRSSNWKNVFKADQKSYINGRDTNFTGFFQPRYRNGTWGYQDPIFCSPLESFSSCYLNPQGHETYEGSSWLYTFYVPHDMATLITRLGGSQEFTSRLSYLHDSNLVYMGDEQAFLTVFQFHYSGRPALSSQRAHYYIPSQFSSSIAGIPGNDDGGAMGAFAVLSMLGLWPVHGQDVYLITPPFFKEISIWNKVTGKAATVRNINFDPSYKSVYIQSAKLNGKPWTKNWITHDFFTKGGVLELTLGFNESTWGTHAEDLPPSISQ